MDSNDTKRVNAASKESATEAVSPSSGFGVIAYFANNSVAANLVMGLLLIGGLISGIGLNAQVFPTLNPGICLLYTSPSPRDMRRSRMPSSA